MRKKRSASGCRFFAEAYCAMAEVSAVTLRGLRGQEEARRLAPCADASDALRRTAHTSWKARGGVVEKSRGRTRASQRTCDPVSQRDLGSRKWTEEPPTGTPTTGSLPCASAKALAKATGTGESVPSSARRKAKKWRCGSLL